ncbi:MAG: 2,3,4,5-tetrahydropyridine-2,6-dicarboxylate N-succinyltransferase [Gammaproteobacteria bacterium]|nr:2,3,4,5-tetrahydropyridine-2,6-dicarboxylate N-succinyltransferase [Gammaproteobacteria bacterium]MYK82011.1 2,3,4,5-tetrahydropyridine-2,6-dicarboxylate N-succinyltransferase [Gammaproteobacteria bacterium]
MPTFAFAIGLPTLSRSGTCIDCFFPAPLKAPEGALEAAIHDQFAPGEAMIEPDAARAFINAHQPHAAPMLEADRPLVAVLLAKDGPIGSTAEAFLKLHLLSHRLALPNTLNLDGIFAHLQTVAWTTEGAVALDELATRQMRARVQGHHFEVLSVDKFPKMANYIVPSGVRIADSSRIRLGAYLGEGTTVMPYGAINFNAAALGPNMVEGRVSQGVVLGHGSDIGGSASIMGTLAGGGEIVISIGRQCLIGANAGTGIPLGDRCTIEAGLYITAGTRVALIDEDGNRTGPVKARELAGRSDLLFIRHSETGEVQCRVNRKAIALNEQLHAHN